MVKWVPFFLALAAFGVAGAIAMIAGAAIETAIARALVSGAVFYLFGKLLAYILLYDPASPQRIETALQASARDDSRKAPDNQ